MLLQDVTSKVLVAEAWVPTYAKAQVQDVLARASMASHAQVCVLAHVFCPGAEGGGQRVHLQRR
jgi:V-type H+-transporting ATPase subunit a